MKHPKIKKSGKKWTYIGTTNMSDLQWDSYFVKGQIYYEVKSTNPEEDWAVILSDRSLPEYVPLRMFAFHSMEEPEIDWLDHFKTFTKGIIIGAILFSLSDIIFGNYYQVITLTIAVILFYLFTKITK